MNIPKAGASWPKGSPHLLWDNYYSLGSSSKDSVDSSHSDPTQLSNVQDTWGQ